SLIIIRRKQAGCCSANAGDPIRYDALRIEHDQGAVEIVVYKRAILLFTTDSEAVRRIHQVCCRLDDLVAR
ncbi:MAG TPA: hypothetical protein VN945_01635, partial [Gemmatimonadales bacterium]|nr:hypothetical protein [Gemmatimonadales bacterium]